MIRLSRINNEIFFLNHKLIETIEQTPDTVVRLTTGEKFLVKETPEKIVELIRNTDQNKRQEVDTEVADQWI